MITTGYTQKDWQQALATALNDPVDLLTMLELDQLTEVVQAAERISQLFPLRVPLSFVKKMRKRCLNDPLLRQVLPLQAEATRAVGFVKDPLKEREFSPFKGILHKYRGRVLWMIAGTCAIHCRYCFRRHYLYSDHIFTRSKWQSGLNYLRQNPDVDEVIFSGGDPLLIKDTILGELIEELTHLKQIKRIRIHTRLPIVLPERITDNFLQLCQQTRFQIVLVVHCNHAQELDQHVAKILSALRAARVILLNQTVLLKGVNDHLSDLVELSKQLFAMHVIPYYIHQLDPVDGSKHFEVTELRRKRLMRGLLASLPGYMVPKFVQEIPGGASKEWLTV